MGKNDLISRAAAIAEIEEYIEEYSELEPETGYHNLKWCAMEEAKDVLSMLPAVDAVPVVHSSWHWTQDGYVYCENCTFPLAKTKVNIDGVERHLYLTTNYCAHCGAKMDGDTQCP